MSRIFKNFFSKEKLRKNLLRSIYISSLGKKNILVGDAGQIQGLIFGEGGQDIQKAPQFTR